MSRQRLEISIAYTDGKGVKRYANKIGNVWIDLTTLKGSIDLPPGVSISGGSHYINVAPPFEGEEKGQRRPTPRGENRGIAQPGDDDIPF